MQQTSPNITQYVTEGNERFSELATRFGVSESELRQFNPNMPEPLKSGLTVKIPEHSCPQGKFYRIRPGESLSQIAEHFSTTVESMIEANPYLRPAHCVPGQTIVVPESKREPQTTVYIIGPRESIADVLRKFDMSVLDVKQLNPDRDIFCLQPGDTLCVLDWKTRSGGRNSYIIGMGENLATLAAKFSVNQVELLKCNPNLRPQEFCKGQRILLPPRR